MRSSIRLVAVLALFAAACGMAPHQASSTADAPKVIVGSGVDASAPIASPIPIAVDAGTPASND